MQSSRERPPAAGEKGPEHEQRLRGLLYGLLPGADFYQVEGILARMRAARAKAPDARPGESVRVIAGAFAGRRGTLVEIRAEQQTVRVELVESGKPIVVEFGFDEIELGSGA